MDEIPPRTYYPIIRPARPEDAAAVARIQVATWRQAYAGILSQALLDGLSEERSARHWEEAIRAGGQGKFLLVAESEGALRGFASGGPLRHPVPGYEGEVYAFYVEAGHQRQGLGSALFAKARETLSASGMESLVVWVLKENPHGAFYRKAGGVPVGEKPIILGGETHLETGYGWRYP